jgi:hypothetical protein
VEAVAGGVPYIFLLSICDVMEESIDLDVLSDHADPADEGGHMP